MRDDMTALIERVPAIESRLGISFSGLYAYGEGDWVYFNGELHSAQDDVFEHDVLIVVNLYDAAGRMLGMIEHDVPAEDFVGFESFSLLANLNQDRPRVTRIRIYAKKI